MANNTLTAIENNSTISSTETEDRELVGLTVEDSNVEHESEVELVEVETEHLQPGIHFFTSEYRDNMISFFAYANPRWVEGAEPKSINCNRGGGIWALQAKPWIETVLDFERGLVVPVNENCFRFFRKEGASASNLSVNLGALLADEQVFIKNGTAVIAMNEFPTGLRILNVNPRRLSDVLWVELEVSNAKTNTYNLVRYCNGYQVAKWDRCAKLFSGTNVYIKGLASRRDLNKTARFNPALYQGIVNSEKTNRFVANGYFYTRQNFLAWAQEAAQLRGEEALADKYTRVGNKVQSQAIKSQTFHTMAQTRTEAGNDEAITNISALRLCINPNNVEQQQLKADGKLIVEENGKFWLVVAAIEKKVVVNGINAKNLTPISALKGLAIDPEKPSAFAQAAISGNANPASVVWNVNLNPAQ